MLRNRLKYKIQSFKFKPFSVKQKKALTWWTDGSPYKNYDAIICDGAVRSGKTISLGLSFVIWAMDTFDGCNFAICGKTVGSVRRNVVNELKKMLKGRKYIVEDYRTDNLLIISKNGKVNYFYVFGGKDESSQDIIAGITLAGVLFDEVARQVESFVNQAVARCSIEGAKLFFNCNPEGPYHWFKLNWIDLIKQKRILYLHFIMDDNFSLSEEVKKRYKRNFSGIFYTRNIDGKWVLAQGVIYDMFTEENNVKHIDQIWERTLISIDYGIQNPMTYGLFGTTKGKYHLIDRYYHSGKTEGKQKTDVLYADDLEKFITQHYEKHKIKYITVDPSATSFIAELQTRTFLKNKNIKIIPAKNAVMKGIQLLSTKIQEGNFTIEPHCVEDKKEFASYIWDEKATARGIDEPLKENDHCLDSCRYACFTDTLLYSNRVNHSGRGSK